LSYLVLLADHPLLLHNIGFWLGFASLILGANILVKNASRFAISLGIKPVVVGLTIVAFGTSVPELVVSSVAAYTGKSGIALGNVIGSNIANIGLILGITALLRPMKVQAVFFTSELPIMLGVTAAFIVMLHDGIITRVEGAILLATLIGYLCICLRTPKDSVEVEETSKNGAVQHIRSVVLMVFGLVLLATGAQQMVVSGAFIARAFGVSELIIGITLFAIGSSLPELATCIMGVIRKQGDISIGNIVGSNIFNIACVIGTAALIAPLHTEHDVFLMEVPVLLAFSAGLLLFMRTNYNVSRWEGTIFLTGYVAFMIGLFV